MSRSAGDRGDPWVGASNGAGAGRAETLLEEQTVLVAAWRAACDVATPGSAPETAAAEAVVSALAAALHRHEAGPDAAVSDSAEDVATAARAARTLVHPSANLEVAIRQLACLRDIALQRLAAALPAHALQAAQQRANAVLDAMVEACAAEVSDRLREAAFIDPLTGLFNRRAMERDLAREVARADRHGLNLSVVMIDLDGLKTINDRDGHAAGDRALCSLAEALRAGLRADDTAYRLGGDEFLALLPETPAAEVGAIVERILASGPPPFTWGASTIAESGADAVALLDAADQRLLEWRRAARTERSISVVATQPESRQWQKRRMASAAMRLTVVMVPMAAGVIAAVAAARALGRPDGLAAAVGWWAAVLAVSSLAAMVVDRLARRLLPLAALLRLSMIFPDRAPSRLAVALRAGSVRVLRSRVERLRQHGLSNEPSKAAGEVLVLLAALRDHDRPTRGHSERVRAYTDLLAKELGLGAQACEQLRWAGLLHDIGKLTVDPEILNKRGALDGQELERVHAHPTEGGRVVAPLRAWLGEWAAAVEQHHERWDGQGYPAGLAGDQISLGARIVAVADAFEVMTAPRSYRTALRPAAARAELARCAGYHFDPKVVRAFLNLSIGRLRWAMGPLAWLARVPVVAGVAHLSRAGTMIAGTGTAAALVLGGGVVSLPPEHQPSRDQVAAPAPKRPQPATTVPVPATVPLSVAPGETLTTISSPVPITALTGGTIAPGISVPRPGAPVPPGNGVAILSLRDVTLAPGARYALDLNGAEPGSGYDQLDVVGRVNLDRPNLEVSLGYTPGPGQSFIIINNDADDLVVGTFAGLPERTIFSVGAQRLQISYQGGSNNNDVVLTSVDTAATTTSLASSRDRATYGQPVTLVATVSSTAADPSGTVTFSEDGETIGTAQLDSKGTARFVPPNLPAGSHTFRAAFSGGSLHGPSTSAPFVLVVDQDSSTVALTSSGSAAVGEPVTFTAAVKTAHGGPATGTVTFRDGAAVLGNAVLGAANSASFTTSALLAGDHPVTASYAGDANVTPSASATATVTVGKATPSVRLTSSDNPSLEDEPVTFTALVAPARAGAVQPTGTVSFFDGETLLGAVSLDSAGGAALTVSLSAGQHAITAVYGGDANYVTAPSPALLQVATGV